MFRDRVRTAQTFDRRPSGGYRPDVRKREYDRRGIGPMTDLSQLDTEAERIVAKYDQKRAATLTLLHLAQDKVGFVSPDVEAWVSKSTDVPVVHVREVVTFYSMYHQKPAGRHHIRFCTSTSCVLQGGEKILECLKKKLWIEDHGTTRDGKFSLEEAE